MLARNDIHRTLLRTSQQRSWCHKLALLGHGTVVWALWGFTTSFPNIGNGWWRCGQLLWGVQMIFALGNVQVKQNQNHYYQTNFSHAARFVVCQDVQCRIRMSSVMIFVKKLQTRVRLPRNLLCNPLRWLNVLGNLMYLWLVRFVWFVHMLHVANGFLSGSRVHGVNILQNDQALQTSLPNIQSFSWSEGKAPCLQITSFSINSTIAYYDIFQYIYIYGRVDDNWMNEFWITLWFGGEGPKDEWITERFNIHQ